MSETIDQRVVEMKFDNKKFEDGIKESMSTLTQFDKSLNSLGNNSKAFDGINKSIHNLDFNPLQTGLELAANKFNWLESIAVGALMRIGSKITDYVTTKFNELTIAPIKQGFDEYELKMGAVQTILASTGEDLQTVNGYLEQLNLYADKTIYSFSDMTQNIGKFTNNGVKLEDAVKAIQGVSNAAAVAGANSNEASRAMYNFSQALSQGSVKLIDWKSIQNANMATTDFKQNLIDTAVAMGTLVKQGDQYVSTTTDMNGHVSELFDANKMFNESLSAQWMTTEVLVQTLSNYSTDIREMTDAEKEEYEQRLKSIGYTEEQIQSIEELGKKAFDAAQDVKTYSQLIDTLKEAVGSGWSQTFELIFGDFAEAKNLWTSINNAISPIIDGLSNSRNNMLKEWKEWGGRDDVISAISTTWKNFSTIVGTIVDAFKELFALEPVKKFEGVAVAFKTFEISGASDMLLKFSAALKELSEKLTPTDATLDKIHRTFRGLFSILDIVRQAFVALVYAVTPAGSVVGDLVSILLDGTATIGDWLYNLDMYIKENNIFISAIDKVKDVLADFSSFIEPKLARVKEVLQGIIETMKTFASEHFKMPETSIFEGLAENMEERFAPLKSIGEFFKAVFSKIGEALSVIAPKIWEAAGRIAGGLGAMFSKIAEWVKNANFNAFLDLVNTGAFALLAYNLGKVADIFQSDAEGKGNFFNLIIDTIKGFIGNKDDIEGFFNSFSESLTNCFKSIEAELKVKTIKDIATALAILAGSVLVLSMIDSEKLAASIAAISVLFVELAGAMKFFDAKMSGGTLYQNRWGKMMEASSPLQRMSTSMIEFSSAILILAIAMKKIGSIDSEKLTGSIIAISGLIAELVGVMVIMDQLNGSSTFKMTALIGFAMSIQILASAMKKIGDIDPNRITTAMIGISGLIVEMVGALVVFSSLGVNIETSAIGMIALSTAILILSDAMKKIGELDIKSILKGLIVIQVLLIELENFMVGTTFKGGAGIFEIGVAMTIIATSMLILIEAMRQIGELDIKSILKGLVVMQVLFVQLENFMVGTTFKGGSGIFGIGVTMTIIAASILVLVEAMRQIGELDIETIAKGLITIGALLTEIELSMRLMEGTVKSALTLVIVSAALLVLAKSLKTIGQLKLWEIIKALGLLAATFTLVAVAGILLEPAIPAMLALAGVMAVISLSVFVVSAGLLMFVTALTALAAGGVVAIKTIVTMMDILFEGVLRSIVSKVELITEAVTTIVLSILNTVKILVPTIVETVLTLIETILKALSEHVPSIVTYLLDFLINVIDALAEKIPTLVSSIMNFLGALFEGVIDALNKVDPETFQNGLLGVGFISAIIVSMSGVAALVPTAMVGIVGAAAVVTELALIIAALGDLAQSTNLQWLVEDGGNLLQAVGTAIGQFIGGIVGGFANGLTDQLPEIAANLSGFMTNLQPFADGIRSIDASVLEGTTILAGVITLLTASEVINGIANWMVGGTDLGEFGREMASFGVYLSEFAESTSGINGAEVEAAAKAAYALVDVANALPNSGGVLSAIVGDNLLSDFGHEMKKFGPDLMKFAESVTGIDAASVEGAARATSTLVTAIDNLPNSGGMVAWFTGDNLLSAFGDELKDYGRSFGKFAEYISDFDQAKVEAVAAATSKWVQSIADLPNSGGMVSWFTGDNLLSAFGEELKDYGRYISKFSETVAGIETKGMEDAASVTETWIQKIANLPNSGGMVSWFTGDNLLSAFGEQLKDYGRYLAKCAETVTGLDTYGLEEAARITALWILKIAELPNSGGMISWFTGDNLLSAFGEQLEDYGRSFSKFSEKVSGISVESVQGCMDATATLINTLKDMPNQGGVVAWFTGDNLLDAFGDQLEWFGADFAEYASAVSNVPANIVDISTYIASSLRQFADGMPTTGGLAEKIFGEVDLEDFGEELSEFGPYFAQYAESVNGLTSNVVAVTSNITTALADMAARIPNSLANLDLDRIGSKLKMFGPNVSLFAKNIDGIDTTRMKGVIEQLGNLANISNDISSINGEGINGLITAVSTFAGEIVAEFIDNLTNGCSSIKSKAQEMMQALVEGMNAKKYTINSTVTTICNSVVTEIRARFDKRIFYDIGYNTIMQSILNGMTASNFTISSTVNKIGGALNKEFGSEIKSSEYIQIGENVIEGLIEGLQSMRDELEKEVKSIAKLISEVTKDKLKVHSPSEEAAEIGMYWDLGLAKGLEEYKVRVTESGEMIGESAIESMKESIKKIATVTPDDLEFRPTISPTLDLTEIRNGYANIGELFSKKLSMGVGIDNAQAATRNLRVTAVNDTGAQMQQNAKQLDSINNELKLMRSELNGLKDIYGGLEVRMDTGALVGQLVNPMDRAMGSKAVIQQRRRGR